MVIFGAGASYDSCPTYPPGKPVPPRSPHIADLAHLRRLPLANDLFDNRDIFVEALDNFPQCKTIVAKLRSASLTPNEVSIEAVLQRIQDEAANYPRGLQELAGIRYYLQRAIRNCQGHWYEISRGVTNYLALVREIERTSRGKEPVCLVTFNYDTLLEEALGLLGKEHAIHTPDDYVKNSRLFRVFKLHGSVNWAQEVDNPALPPNINPGNPQGILAHLIERAADLEISERYALCEPANGMSDGRLVFPAIAIPVEGKSVFQCPRTMLQELKNILPDVKKVMIIGWRATEAHFLDLLKEYLGREVFISVVAADERAARDSQVRISRVLINNRPGCCVERAAGFTEYMLSGRALQVLES